MAVQQLLLTLLLLFTSLVAGADTAAWKSRNIYFALTDRISRGETDEGGQACGNLGNYCGGTFKGLKSKLDYIKGMGFDAVWITPVVSNSPGGYHGYWAKELYAINSNYGTADDLKDLVNAAHDRGIYIMADVVANHMGQGSISENTPAPLNDPSSYHPNCDIDYSNQSSIEECRIAGLPDLYTQKEEIRDLLQDWVKWLVTEYKFDGIRIDTVKHVEKDFWPGFVDAAGVYSIGEVWDGNPQYLAGYARLMPGLLNYAVFYPMNNFYQQKGSSQAIVDMHGELDSLFPDPSALGTFLDNHDNKRWLAQKNDHALLKNALAYVILARGIPIVYYGTEQGYAGGDDPANREDLWRSNFNTDSDLYLAISRLSKARVDAGGLAANDHVHLYTTNNAYAWSRAGGQLLVFTTNTGTSTNGQYCFNSQRANGQWTNVFGSGTYTSDGSGNVCVQISNGEPVVLLSGTSPAPTTTGSSPPPSGTACPSLVAVTFNEKVTTAPGDTIKIVGNIAELGSWQPSAAPALSAASYTEDNPVWSGTVSLPVGASVSYKFVNVKADGSISWESDPNRSYDVPSCQSSAIVDSEWR